MNSTEAKIKRRRVTSSLARRRQRRRATSSLARRLARHVLVRPAWQWQNKLSSRQCTGLLQQVTCSEQQPTGKLLEWSDPISLD